MTTPNPISGITTRQSTHDGPAYAAFSLGRVGVEWSIGIVGGCTRVLVSLLLMMLRDVGIMGVRLLAIGGVRWVLVRIRRGSILVVFWCATKSNVSYRKAQAVPKLTNSLSDLVDCSRRRHHTARPADRVENHRVEEGHMSLLSAEAHIQQVHHRTEGWREDNPAGHRLVGRSLGIGHTVVLEVGSQERGRRNLVDTGCMG